MGRKSTGRLFKRKENGSYYLEYFVHGKRFCTVLKDENGKGIKKKTKAIVARDRIIAPLATSDEIQKRELIASTIESEKERLARLEEDLRIYTSLDDAFELYLSKPSRPDSGERTLKDYLGHWESFKEYTKRKFKLVLFRDVTKEIAEKYAVQLSKKAPATFNRHLNFLSLIYKTLADHEKVEVNPFSHIKRKKLKQNVKKELPWKKVCEICDNAEGEIKKLIFIGIYTGMRLGDCCTLRWNEVDLIRELILKTNAKTGKTPQLAIHPALMAQLESCSERSGFVLENTATSYLKDPGAISKKIQKLLIGCDIEVIKAGTGKGTGKRAVVQYGFHSFRHTFVSLLKDSGVSQAVAMELVGHGSTAISQRYTHVGDSAIRQAIGQLPAIGEDNLSDLRREVLESVSIMDEVQLRKLSQYLKVV